MDTFEDPEDRYWALCDEEIFRMSREDLIFVVLCERLKKAEKFQFFKSAQLAEEINCDIERRERLVL